MAALSRPGKASSSRGGPSAEPGLRVLSGRWVPSRSHTHISFPNAFFFFFFQQRDACSRCDLCGILILPLGSVSAELKKGQRNARAEEAAAALPAENPGVPSVNTPAVCAPPPGSPQGTECLQEPRARRGRAPSHHLWPRNVSPSHLTPFHRRFRRYSISGNTAAHLRSALDNRAACRRGALPEERCFSKLSLLSARFKKMKKNSLPPSPQGPVQTFLKCFLFADVSFLLASF